MTWKLQAITGELDRAGSQRLTVICWLDAIKMQTLLLQAAEISRRHAAFLLKEDALWVQDLKFIQWYLS